MLMPDVKIKTIQVQNTRSVWPISGWIINNNEITNIKLNDIRDLKYRLVSLLPQSIVANIIIKNGFNNSIGWNLGKKNKSIHLFEPFISVPMIGIKIKKIKQIKKRILEYLNNWLVSIEEKIKIKNIRIQI